MSKEKPQIDKFREAAKELEADESPEAFERKLKKIIGGDKPAKSDDKKSD